MESEEYSRARDLSRGLFNNALVLPIALSIREQVKVGSDFTAGDLRAWLQGRSASNQIRDALGRIESTGAIFELPYPGRPYPRRWQRAEHPLWRFVDDWIGVEAKA